MSLVIIVMSLVIIAIVIIIGLELLDPMPFKFPVSSDKRGSMLFRNVDNPAQKVPSLQNILNRIASDDSLVIG
jgi:hypothetical protein